MGAFGKDAAERSVATAIQALLAVLGVNAIDVASVNATATVVIAVLGAVLSLVKSLIARKFHDRDSASLADLPGRHAARE